MPPDTEDSVPAGDTDLKSFTQEQIDSIDAGLLVREIFLAVAIQEVAQAS